MSGYILVVYFNKSEKKKILLVYYLYFCISLHRIIIRYLRSNGNISPLISNTLSLTIYLNDSF